MVKPRLMRLVVNRTLPTYRRVQLAYSNCMVKPQNRQFWESRFGQLPQTKNRLSDLWSATSPKVCTDHIGQSTRDEIILSEPVMISSFQVYHSSELCFIHIRAPSLLQLLKEQFTRNRISSGTK